MGERVQKVVSDTCAGVAFLMKKNKIEVFEGLGSFVDANTLKVVGKQEKTIKGKNLQATAPNN